MIFEDYLSNLKRVSLPDELLTKTFIRNFSVEHSWYKHLTEERESSFIFYINKNGLWDYYYQYDESQIDLPKEIKRLGKIMLSNFIFGKFNGLRDQYFGKTKLSYAEMHMNEISHLEKHLLYVLEDLKSKLI